jgi:hypothetical protein
VVLDEGRPRGRGFNNYTQGRHAIAVRNQATSKRSRFMTLSHAATKSRTNFGCASSDA